MLVNGTTEDDNLDMNSLTYKPPVAKKRETRLMQRKRRITEGIKGVWYRLDENFLKIHFGGEPILDEVREQNDRRSSTSNGDGASWPGNYEMGNVNGNSSRIAGETSKPNFAQPRNQMEDIEEEMISLTSSFDAE